MRVMPQDNNRFSTATSIRLLKQPRGERDRVDPTQMTGAKDTTRLDTVAKMPDQALFITNR